MLLDATDDGALWEEATVAKFLLANKPPSHRSPR